MGRYYSGDIEGKFWVGVQPSNDADFFGSEGYTPSLLNYAFEADDKDEIELGITECKDALGDYKKKLDAFFAANNGYNDEMLVKTGFPAERILELLRWYARLELGEKILKCVVDTGQCYFEAET